MKPIRGGNFYEFVKCPRKVYMNFFGDYDKKLLPSEFMQQQFQEGRDFEDAIAAKYDFQQPDEDLSFDDAAKETVKLMENKADMIYQGILKVGDYLGIPDFLEKKKGKSNLGNHYYEIVDVKKGLSAKQEYIMQVVFYSFMLEKIQGRLPDKAYLILGNEERVEINIQEHIENFSKILERIQNIKKGHEEEVHIASVCKECPWRGICIPLAEEQHHISRIYNLPRDRIEMLKSEGIQTLEDAADMDVEKLAQIKGLTEKSLNKWKLQAQSLLQKKAIIFNKPEFSKDTAMFFDVEDIEYKGERIIYLFGIVIDDDFIAFIAKTPQEEHKAWNDFLRYFADKEDFKLYVYSPHEKSILRKLYNKHGGDEHTYNKILNNIVDLLPILKNSAVLPIIFYSIKDVAKYLGFKWTSVDAGGAQSMIWYDKWLETQDRKYLDEVIRYNEEDCKAMVKIKAFLEK